MCLTKCSKTSKNARSTAHFPSYDSKHYCKCTLLKKAHNVTLLRGTQLPNLSGNSVMRSSLMRSFSGPRITTGRAYFTVHTNMLFCQRISINQSINQSKFIYNHNKAQDRRLNERKAKCDYRMPRRKTAALTGIQQKEKY